MSEEKVDHPAHYNQYEGLEVIDLVEQMSFNRGNAVKYIARAGFKGPESELEDLEKARWYINREIERLQKRTERMYVHAIEKMKKVSGTPMVDELSAKANNFLYKLMDAYADEPFMTHSERKDYFRTNLSRMSAMLVQNDSWSEERMTNGFKSLYAVMADHPLHEYDPKCQWCKVIAQYNNAVGLI